MNSNSAPATPAAKIDLGDARPEEIFHRLAHLEPLVFLDTVSAAPELHDSRVDRCDDAISLIAAKPERVIRGHLSDPGELRDCLRRKRAGGAADLGIPLGGAFGYVDFDGSFAFAISHRLLIYFHSSGDWFETGDGELSREIRADAVSPPDPVLPAPRPQPLRFAFETGREPFCDAVRKALDYIAAGDIYQANLSHRAWAPWRSGHDNALRFYGHLREVSPAPYAAFLRLADRTILCSSPELFLKMSGSVIRTRPIKGTRPRFADLSRDEKSAYDLITSPKEVAELIMITDLERNDLGRVCQYGTVSVPELLKLERFAQVFHLVSTVQGTLAPGNDHLAALQACFPGGSISGAPKKRALEIIAELEAGPRGLYTGAVGYLGFNGESQFNIAIRTAVIENGAIHFQVGAGIVADSQPGPEYEETLHKASGILGAAEAYNREEAAAPEERRPPSI